MRSKERTESQQRQGPFVALQGKMGINKYYVVTMKVSDLLSILSLTDDYIHTATPFRRQFHFGLNKEDLVAYLVNGRGRFFGSIIVQVSGIEYEDFEKGSISTHQTADSLQNTAGLLYFPLKPTITVLDGIQRLYALHDIEMNQGEYGDLAQQVLKDDISLLILEQPDDDVVRNIGTKVQRQSKSSGRSDFILMNDEDDIAVLSRRLIEPDGILDSSEPIRALVNWKNTTLSERSAKLTTLTAIYEINRLILQHKGFDIAKPSKKHSRLEKKEFDEAYSFVMQYWRSFLHEIDPYRRAIENRYQIVQWRQPDSPYALLFKTPVQIGIFEGLLKAERRSSTPFRFLAPRVNGMNWCATADIWKPILTSDYAIKASKDAQQFVADKILDHVRSSDTNYNR